MAAVTSLRTPTPAATLVAELVTRARAAQRIADSYDQAVAVLRGWGVLGDRVKV